MGLSSNPVEHQRTAAGVDARLLKDKSVGCAVGLTLRGELALFDEQHFLRAGVRTYG